MSRKHYDHIRDNPDFHDLIRQKSKLSWTLSILILLVYYSFILIIAFAPEALGVPVSAGGTATWGIVLGLGVILFTFLITGIYVHRANTIYDNLLINVINASENHVNAQNQEGDSK
jgi:uncharacterized membrane protein (DUF485 family)